MVPTGPTIRRRLALAMVLFLALFGLLAWQLFRLQVLEAADLQRRAQSQWTRESLIAPRRGTIYDRDGGVLAMSATAYTLSVSPRQVADPQALAQALAPILDMEAETIAQRAGDRSKGGVTLKRQLDAQVAQQLRVMMAQSAQQAEDPLQGLYLEEDQRRYYPMGDMVCQLIGLTTVDGVGQSGLEKGLDKYLSGRWGRVLDQIDGKGRALAQGAQEYVAPVDGSAVTLTIDGAIQSILEQAAREAMTVNGAKAVRALVMDPRTGEILAMCSKPAFDLNDPPRDDLDTLNDLMRNRVVADAYEPGSTFKVITTAAALDSGVTTVDEGFYCSGSVVVEGGRIRCWGNPHGAETMARALENSCNPVFVELGLRLGVERFYDFLDAFGLGRVTGVDIPGEAAGILIPRASCKRVDIARVGFGQSVAVTPLQLLCAASAAVNGGKLMKPYVVKEVVDPQGQVTYRGEPQQMGQPISEKTSATMRTLLEGVVRNGGGRNAYLERYRVGGKTGTAQFYVDGVVSSDTHIGSFMGFAPIDDPQVALLFIVDEASIRPDFGSVTAAPFAKQVLERTLVHLGVAPSDPQAQEPPQVTVPGVVGMDSGEALAALKAAGLSGMLEGEGAQVAAQLPEAGVEMAKGSLVTLYLDQDPQQPQAQRTVPDLAGLSIAQANRLLQSYGLALEIQGSGVAVAQAPQPGAEVQAGDQVKVTFALPGRSGETG